MISKVFFYSSFLLLLTINSLFAQVKKIESSKQKFTLSGTISDLKSNETIIGVNVFIPELKTGTTTNEYGFYSITIPKGNYTVEISYISYQTITESINLDKNIKNDYKLSSAEEQLQEVIITDNRKATNIRKAEMSVNKLSAATIKKMPVVLGEVDILKSILLLPGVTNAGEGASGFNVRGGGADQNLILLDEANIFNSSHVFGFFSVFNPDAIKDLKLYKGGIPARYGGRASSVLDIYQKDGNSNNFHASGGIGLISSRLLLEGPIVKNKGSFLVGGRGSYAHLFLKLNEKQKDNSAYFYDLNTKLSYKLNPNNNLYLSGYFGRDVFSIKKSFTNIYGNSTLNLRWNHLFTNKLFSNLSLIYSDYYYGLELGLIGFTWDSGIKNYNIKYDFKNYISDNFKLNYGVNAIYYDFNPGTIRPIGESGINFKQLEKKKALEPSIYIEAEQNISNKISLSYGFRYSLFYRMGASNINNYVNNEAVIFNQEQQIYESAIPTSSTYYGENKTIADFSNFEPRASIAYQFTDNQSVKASYNRMVQYLQLISNTSSPTPLDVWTPSDSFIKPQIADQVAVGYFRNFKDDEYSLEVESFYKTIKNRIDYIDGANLIANEAIEQIILNGRMRSYGLEVMLRKNEGKLTGWISYTLSKSQQQTPGRNASETGINNGEWYNSLYDKTHNLAITSAYTLSKKWSFGANFALQTGQPVTYPNGQYEYLEDITVPSYGLRNENRLPTYHHLDISATLTPHKNKDRKWKGEWVFSIYNIYNRKNAASINFRQNAETGVNEAVKTSIFGMVPAVSYNFKF
jgi:outer membrane receptor protein involved in Fe transport